MLRRTSTASMAVQLGKMPACLYVGVFPARWISGLGVVVVVTACSSGAGGNGEPPPASRQAFSAALARAVCDATGPCCQAARIPFDPIQCAARAEQDIQRDMDSLFARGYAIEFRADSAERCIAEFAAAASVCRQWECDLDLGTRGEGEACANEIECTEPVGEKSARCVEGRCQRRREVNPPFRQYARGSAGDACIATCSPADLYRPEIHLGDCGGQDEPGVACHIDDGLYCQSSARYEPGRCMAIAGPGDGCGGATTNWVDPYACGRDAYCQQDADTGAGNCALRQPSGSCAYWGDESCTVESFCSRPAVGPPECTPKRRLGEPCMPHECLEGTCLDGVCAVDPNLQALCAGTWFD